MDGWMDRQIDRYTHILEAEIRHTHACMYKVYVCVCV